MNRKRRRRTWVLVAVAVAVIVAVTLVLTALKSNINWYFTPGELAKSSVTPQQRIRIGGWVQKGSVQFSKGHQIQFVLTDHKATVTVRYHGLLPSLFREGQGIVVSGYRVSAGKVRAVQVLAKHDENYHPPKLVDKIRRGEHDR